ncbi:MAG: hypothetical protein IH840_11745 [Candidatus Heimdallarchaeota archaeon]|nr:hypothetical protein [Candidatus Heimdallarchaeota archaeon]
MLISVKLKEKSLHRYNELKDKFGLETQADTVRLAFKLALDYLNGVPLVGTQPENKVSARTGKEKMLERYSKPA